MIFDTCCLKEKKASKPEFAAFFVFHSLFIHSFQIASLCCCCFRVIMLEMTRQGAAASAFNQINYIEVNKHIVAAKREHKRVLQMLLRFWQYLLSETIDLGMMNTREFEFELMPSAFCFFESFSCLCVFVSESVQLDIIHASRVAADMFLLLLERYKIPSVMRAYANCICCNFACLIPISCLFGVCASRLIVSDMENSFRMFRMTPLLRKSFLTMQIESRYMLSLPVSCAFLFVYCFPC